MLKSELKDGMIVRTQSNRYGVVELERNRINICYDPDMIHDEDRVFECVSLDSVFNDEQGRLFVGAKVTQEIKDKYPSTYGEYQVGEVCFYYEIVDVYQLNHTCYIHRSDSNPNRLIVGEWMKDGQKFDFDRPENFALWKQIFNLMDYTVVYKILRQWDFRTNENLLLYYVDDNPEFETVLKEQFNIEYKTFD